MNIKTKNLFYKYPNTHEYSLKNLSFSLKDNFTVLIGHNASGKSTLVNVLNLVNTPSLGLISFDESVVNNLSTHLEKMKLRENVNMVYQFSDIQIFNITLIDELLFYLKSNKLPIDNALEEIEYYFKLFNLPLDLLSANPFHLSGGQKKKIAIITILLLKPKLLILDEPTVGLDFESKKQILSSLKQFADQGKFKILMITHNFDDVFNYADSVLEIDNGILLKHISKLDFLIENYENKKFYYLPEAFKYLAKYNIPSKKIREITNEEDILTLIKEKHELLKS